MKRLKKNVNSSRDATKQIVMVIISVTMQTEIGTN